MVGKQTLVCLEIRVDDVEELVRHVGDTFVAGHCHISGAGVARGRELASSLRREGHRPVLGELLPNSGRFQLCASPHDASHKDMHPCFCSRLIAALRGIFGCGKICAAAMVQTTCEAVFSGCLELCSQQKPAKRKRQTLCKEMGSTCVRVSR